MLPFRELLLSVIIDLVRTKNPHKSQNRTHFLLVSGSDNSVLVTRRGFAIAPQSRARLGQTRPVSL